MSTQEDEALPPVEPAIEQKPVPKRAKAKKKVAVEPAPKPRKRKAAAKKKVKATRPAKAKRKTAKPAKRGKVKTKARKTKGRKSRTKAKANIHNKLYKMMKAKLPKKFKSSDGEIDFKKLIKGLKMTPEGVYKWFRGDHMAARNAMPLVKLTKGRIKPVDLIPFVF